jgi:hypothetical protein
VFEGAEVKLGWWGWGQLDGGGFEIDGESAPERPRKADLARRSGGRERGRQKWAQLARVHLWRKIS